jgi:glutamate dehydrogenase
MDDRTPRGFTRYRRDARSKDALLAEAAATLSDETARRFLPVFYARVGVADLAGRSAAAIAAAAASLLALAATRTPGRPTISVTEPQGSGHTVVEIVNDDMPFLVDSVTAEINRQGASVHLVVHPIVRVDRRAGLALVAAPAGAAESWMRVEIDQLGDAERRRALADGLARILADVRAAVSDFPKMAARARAIVAELGARPPAGIAATEVSEARAFLEWMCQDNFTFLGYREYRLSGEGERTRFDVVPEAGLGLLSDAEFHLFGGVRRLADLPAEVKGFLTAPTLLSVNKANVRSTVHRPVHLDAVAVKLFDAAGAVVGERVIVGLFTSMVYIRSPKNIPLLAGKIGRVLERAGVVPGSHDAKALRHILLTYPRDELFQIGDDDLQRIALGVLQLQERQRVALFIRHDPYQRFVSALVYVPRERHSTELRLAFQAAFERAYGGEVIAHSTQMSDDSVLARVHVVVRTVPGRTPAVDQEALEAELVAAARGWDEALKDALVSAHGEARGVAAFARYARAFPVAYTAECAPERAVADIAAADAALASGALQVDLYRKGELLRFRLVRKAIAIPLSDALPMLENMGLRVIDESQYRLQPAGAGDPVFIHDFGLSPRRAFVADPLADSAGRARVHDAFLKVWDGGMESDGFNALVLAAGLDWRAVVVLRAYAKYLRQAGAPFGQNTIEDTLAKHAGIARLLAEYFLVRAGALPGSEAETAAAIEKALESVTNADEDRIVRRYVNLIGATLRTNFRQTGADGQWRPALAFKLDSRKVDDLPAPRPMVEVWVYSPRVEGIHLRFGKVARGGLRWSDRRDDFRTEILSLVKTQMVKNAVIVPVGAKGGFVVKQPPVAGGRDALQAEGVACYQAFVRALLDVTDNIVDGKVAPPPDVTRHDGDDPYFVVAADKGTATFSDIANALSAEYRFWLGDAFASGGSAGYDHKKMGITARGAWESVKRHFREMGHDTQAQDFSVAGVGDMSGDVFGNAMLLSRHIRLVGAFDHRHIFVDPDPDAARSYAERRRLFDLPRSSWADYDRALISKGGGVFERGAKAIALAPEAKARFGLAKDLVAPVELMRAILAAPVDLLYFGGIGTYVKSADERNAEVGDRANDALRLDGRDLGARVIAEGANLGMTQRGRIEYARQGAGGKGGRINTDAIDNSAGVDCSDHEVNIKILLGAAESRGTLARAERDALLAAMTDEVAALVLQDNYRQATAISVTERLGGAVLDRQARFMRALERSGRLDRAVEFLPDEEALAERAAAGQGLTRPELAVLMAYAKLSLYEQLIESDLPDDPRLADDLIAYFPEPLRRRYKDEALGHRLRREIIATATTNSIVNRAGFTLVHELQEETGAASGDIARAYAMVRDGFALRDLWAAIEACDGRVPAAEQIRLLLAVGRLVKRATKWFLNYAPRPLDIESTVARYRPAIDALGADLAAVLDPGAAERLAARAAAERKAGFPELLAARAAALPLLLPLAESVRLAGVVKRPAADAARHYFAAGARFGIPRLADAAELLAQRTAKPWDKRALNAVVDDLAGHQFALAAAVLAASGGVATEAVEAWAAKRAAVVEQTTRLIDELGAGGAAPDLAMLAVANRQLRALIGG